ncbi:hypothetical protein C5O22_02535 [Treponema sp. J25]|nr:hypothetical protein C5O22_02535 [Treponema sp. J25]
MDMKWNFGKSLHLLLWGSFLFGSVVNLSAQQGTTQEGNSPKGKDARGTAVVSKEVGGLDSQTMPLNLEDLVGIDLKEAFNRFGVPLSVYPVRGPESWQDDVVFSYGGFDLYWYKDRVWQVGTSRAYGIQKGDTKERVLALLGEPIIIMDNALVYALTPKAWPLRLRVGFSAQNQVESIYIYRPDF